MVAFVLSLALALVSHSSAHQAAPRRTSRSRGVVVPGVSFAGIKLGDTEQRVRAVWGHNFTTCGYCKDTTWLYEYRGGEPLGAAVRFQNGQARRRVLARVAGRLEDGQGASTWATRSRTSTSTTRRTGTTRCIGFDAITAKTGKVGDGVLQRGRRRLRLRHGRSRR